MIPLITGIWGIIPPGVSDKFYNINIDASLAGNVLLDSNYRFYSGIWLGLGIVMLWIIPSIERQKVPLRIICLLIFLGGIGRVVSILSFAAPPALFVVFTVIELMFPLLIIMHNKIPEA
jgi:hypothetical protein